MGECIVYGSIRKFANSILKEKELFDRAVQYGTNFDAVAQYDKKIVRLKAFQDCVELKEIDRHTLGSLVKRIYVYENKQVVIDFYFMDTFAVMVSLGRKILTDRAAKAQTAERSAK